MKYADVNMELRMYVEAAVLPCYDAFDAAHQREHAVMVIENSLRLAEGMDVDADMVYAIAAYHDVGLCEGRATHHLASGRMMREDVELRRWFGAEQIETMAQAVEDHRASAHDAPRSVYGRIVAEADRNIDVDVIVRRTLQYGLAHYPELDREGHVRRALEHLHEKYGPGGYLKLWIPGSRNERELHRLWRLMEDEDAILRLVCETFDKLMTV